MTTLNLHPEALADLRRSGLSDATIVEAGLYTPAPGDLPRLLGPRLVHRVAHVLVVPYRGVEPFYRAKLFPPVPDGAVTPLRRQCRWPCRGGRPCPHAGLTGRIGEPKAR